ncbi:hypothetical protein ACOME3_010547 [Neoechinorhynchus agilis]
MSSQQQQHPNSCRAGRVTGMNASGGHFDGTNTTATSFKLEKSRQSARECRARKKLRYEYLEELVADREKAIFALQQELTQLQKICDQCDRGQLRDELRDEITSWKSLFQSQDKQDLTVHATPSPGSQHKP